jgi:hypothetical protein
MPSRCGALPVRTAAGTSCAPTPPWPFRAKERQAAPGAHSFPIRPEPETDGSCAGSESARPRAAQARDSALPGLGALRAPLKT